MLVALGFFWRNYAKIMPFFPNYTPFFKIMLFEKIENESKNTFFN